MTYVFESLLKISEKSQWTMEEMMVLASVVKPIIENNEEQKEKAERMETGADEGARAGDHVCLLAALPCQPRAWPKHSLPSGRLGDPRHLCSAPRSPPESLPTSLKQEILLREKSEQEEHLVFPSSHFARGDFEQSLTLWSERSRSHSPLEAQLCHLPAL